MFFTFLIALTFCNFLQKNDPRLIKVLFSRFWATENFSTQLKIFKSYVALGSHFRGLFSTVHCQFSWHQSNKNSTQFYSQFRNFIPCNVLYKIFQIFNQNLYLAQLTWNYPYYPELYIYIYIYIYRRFQPTYLRGSKVK